VERINIYTACSPTLWDRLGQVGLGQAQSCVYILSRGRDGPLAWVESLSLGQGQKNTGRSWQCPGAANVASEMSSFTSRWRMRARPAGGVAEDASARVMTAGLAFSIVYPLLVALQACINAPTTLRYDNGNCSSVECACTPSQTPSCPEKPH